MKHKINLPVQINKIREHNLNLDEDNFYSACLCTDDVTQSIIYIAVIVKSVEYVISERKNCYEILNEVKFPEKLNCSNYIPIYHCITCPNISTE